MLNSVQLKTDFPIFANHPNPPLVYLDNGATTHKPNLVIESIKHYYETENSNIHRGVYSLSQISSEKYDHAHHVVAQFINAPSIEEIIFTRNTTESLNLVANILAEHLVGKSTILLTRMEHHSNLVPWQQLAKKTGMKLEFIELREDFTLDMHDAKKKITSQTAVLAVTHISNVLGTINDVVALCHMAREAGTISVVDAAQSVGHHRVDVQEMDCDFLAFSGHKMFAPTGIGVLYGKKSLLQELPPYLYGGDMISHVSYDEATFADLPMKYEAGTPNIAGAIGLSAAIEYLNHIGMDDIRLFEEDLLAYALDQFAQQLPTVSLYTAGKEKSAGILSFNLPNAHPHDVASLLSDNNICIRAGHHCAMPLMQHLRLPATCRASFSMYNTRKDVDSLVFHLIHILKLFF